jgi:hypothetical protein
MGINFFFTFPTSEGSDLLSSHVMQTPTFISKLSDGNVIFRLDVGKIVYCYISEEKDALLNENDNWITSDSELI